MTRLPFADRRRGRAPPAAAGETQTSPTQDSPTGMPPQGLAVGRVGSGVGIRVGVGLPGGGPSMHTPVPASQWRLSPHEGSSQQTVLTQLPLPQSGPLAHDSPLGAGVARGVGVMVAVGLPVAGRGVYPVRRRAFSREAVSRANRSDGCNRCRRTRRRRSTRNTVSCRVRQRQQSGRCRFRIAAAAIAGWVGQQMSCRRIARRAPDIALHPSRRNARYADTVSPTVRNDRRRNHIAAEAVEAELV